MRKCCLLVVPVFALACSSAPPPSTPANTGQTFAESLRAMCNVDELAAIPKEQEGFERGQARTAWIAEHIENPDGIEFRTLVSVKPAQEQAKSLRERAKTEGIQACPLADSLESDEAASLSP